MNKGLKRSRRADIASGGGALSTIRQALHACKVVKFLGQEAGRENRSFLYKRSFASLKMTNISHSERSEESHKLSCKCRHSVLDTKSQSLSDENPSLPSLGKGRSTDNDLAIAEQVRNDEGNIARKVSSLLTLHTSRKHAAFTLAEVLITLGIIGVLAAMTMPTLISNYQKKVWVTQLKKEINILENGVKLLLIEEGVDNINQSSLWRIVNPSDVRYGYIDENSIKRVFKLSDMPENSRFNKWLEPLGIKGMYFKDGSCVAIGNDTLNAAYISEIYLDTNCDKGPNIPGYDRFIAIHDTWNGPKNLLMNQLKADDISDIEDARNELSELKNYKAQDADEKILRDVLLALCSLRLIIYDGWEMNY